MLQSAAIPYRIDEQGHVLVLLVTSRTRQRWIIPKGRIGARMLASRSAEREAFEEAGVLGRLSKVPVGTYRQTDEHLPEVTEGLTVQAYPLEVTDELPVWQEMEERERRWFSMEEALKAVGDPEIKTILKTFHAQISSKGD